MAKRRGNGEGCIYQRKKGQWAAVVTDGFDPKTGKPKRKFLYGKTREEVKEKLRNVQNQQATGGIVDAGRLNVTTWLTTWCEAYAKHNVKKSTYESYLQQIRCHIIPGLGGILLKRLTTTDIQCFYADLLEHGNKSKVLDEETGEMVDRGGGLSASSVVKIHNILNSSLKQAVAEKRIAFNPAEAAKPPRIEKKEMKVLSQEQVGIFLQKSKEYRYYGAYVLAVTSGMRRGEVLNIPWEYFKLDQRYKGYTYQGEGCRWADLDKRIPWDLFDDIQPWDAGAVADILTQAGIFFETPTVYVRPTYDDSVIVYSPKTEKSIRDFIVPPTTACMLVYQRYRQRKEKQAFKGKYNEADLIFCTQTGRPVPPRSFTRNYQGALKHAGLERLRFHDLRHTVATVLLEEGAALNTVQELLGHHDPTFTAKQYGHVTKRMKAEATDKLSSMLTAAYTKNTSETKSI